MKIDERAEAAISAYQGIVGLVPYAPAVMRECIVAEWRNHVQVLINELSLAQMDTRREWDFGFNNGLRRAIQIIKESAS